MVLLASKQAYLKIILIKLCFYLIITNTVTVIRKRLIKENGRLFLFNCKFKRLAFFYAYLLYF